MGSSSHCTIMFGGNFKKVVVKRLTRTSLGGQSIIGERFKLDYTSYIVLIKSNP